MDDITNTALGAPEANEAAVSAPASSFLDGLPDDLKADKTIAKFANIEELAKGYKNLNSMLGKRVTDLTPDELKSLNIKSGVIPETPDNYKFADDLKDVDMGWYKSAAHEVGLSQEQAKAIADKYVEYERAMIADMKSKHEAATTKAMEDLKAEFGAAFDKRLEIAKKAVDTFGGAELKAYLNETGLGNDPRLIKAFANIGKELLEDTVVSADKDFKFGMTPADAKEKIDLLLRDREFKDAYVKSHHPGHAAAVEEMARLYRLAGGQG